MLSSLQDRRHAFWRWSSHKGLKLPYMQRCMRMLRDQYSAREKTLLNGKITGCTLHAELMERT